MVSVFAHISSWLQKPESSLILVFRGLNYIERKWCIQTIKAAKTGIFVIMVMKGNLMGFDGRTH